VSGLLGGINPWVTHGDFVGADGVMRKTAERTYGLIKLNTAASDPGVGDDSDDGYSTFSEWLNSTTGEVFKCTDASVGAAVWKSQTLLQGGLPDPYEPDGGSMTIDGDLDVVDDLTAGSMAVDGAYTNASPDALTSAATVTPVAADGNMFTLVLAHNVTDFNPPTGYGPGYNFAVQIKQAASGGPYTLALDSVYEGADGSEMPTAASERLVLNCECFESGKIVTASYLPDA
jgi:hypothetical protein